MNRPSESRNIFDRLLKSKEAMPPEVARYFLDISLTPFDLDRIAVLSEKANEGELNSQEDEELHLYVLLLDFLTIVHSRARVSLREQSHQPNSPDTTADRKG